MALDSKNIKLIYASKLAKKYDFSMPPFFISWKKKAFNASSLKRGDRVLVFCCGSGLDFPHILNKIGISGQIVGIDFSSDMLQSAQEKANKHGWNNIELIHADVTKEDQLFPHNFDVGVCTLGMSIIPNYKKAYQNLLSHIKNKGEIIIGDMQLASGWYASFNPFTIFLAKKFGGTHEGHKNSLELLSLMSDDLTNTKKKEFFFNSYYYFVGNKK